MNKLTVMLSHSEASHFSCAAEPLRFAQGDKCCVIASLRQKAKQSPYESRQTEDIASSLSLLAMTRVLGEISNTINFPLTVLSSYAIIGYSRFITCRKEGVR